MKYLKGYILFYSLLALSLPSQALINSESISEMLYPGVVTYYTIIEGQPHGVCTATYVSADTLITAKHCVLGLNAYCSKKASCDMELSSDSATFATVFNEPTKHGIFLPRYTGARVKKIILSSIASLRAGPADDLAFIKLSEEQPGVQTFPLASKQNIQNNMVAVGYGNNMSYVQKQGEHETMTHSGAGVKRRSWAPASEFIFERGMIALVAPSELRMIDDNIANIALLSFFGISPGDSGGPLFTSDHKIIGVASMLGHAMKLDSFERAMLKVNDDQSLEAKTISADVDPQTDLYISNYADLSSAYSKAILSSAKLLGANFEIE